METTNSGTGQTGYSWDVTCTGEGNGGGGCDAELRVSQGDLFTTENKVRDETTRFVTFKCHDCGVLTDLGEASSSVVPRHVVDGLPTKRAWLASTT